MFRSRKLVTLAGLAVAALTLTSCSDSGSDEKSVVIAYSPFEEVIAGTYLWEHILEEEGYDVELVQLDVAAAYTSVAENEADLYMNGVPEAHPDLWEKLGSRFTSVSEWYEPLRHGLVVPEYVDVDSIEDLADTAEEFDNRIIGIEPGTGLMDDFEQATSDYDLDDYEVIGSSSAAMLAEFERAINNEENVVAVAWNPHWAVAEFNMKFLDDPQGSFLGDGKYNVIASEEAQEKVQLMELLSHFEMDDEAFYDLLIGLREAGVGNERESVLSWLEDDSNRDLVHSWLPDN